MLRRKIKLSASERQVFESVKLIMHGLSLYLGDGYEIILHSLEDPLSSAIEVINGHHSGRQIGAPLTDLALKMLEDMEHNDQKKPLAYFNRAKDGAIIKSVTTPILGDNGRIIGLMCINFHMNIPLDKYLATLVPSFSPDTGETFITETFTQNVNDLITNTVVEVRNAVFNDPDIQPANRHKEIIIRLEEKGIFNIKDAVNKVANYLDISKNTVYLHLRNIKSN